MIDLLATPGPANTVDDILLPLSPEMVRNAVASGISAINLSVDGQTVDETFHRIAYWERELNAHPRELCRVRSQADLQAAREQQRLGLIYGFQGTRMLGRNLDLLDRFASFGVRIVQLTYNSRELVGDGCAEPGNAGLSRFGADVVDRLNALRVLVDVAHGGVQTMRDTISRSKAPVAISHSGCKALVDHPRNTADAEMRLLADRGGVIGIYLMPFVATKGIPTAADVVRHIEHAIRVCGEEHVAIGSDLSITPLELTDYLRRTHRTFVAGRYQQGIAAPGEDPDVFFYVPELNSARRLELLALQLSTHGHPDSRIEKIIGGNLARLLREVW